MVGLTEEQAAAQGRDYVTGTSRFVDNSRAAIAGTTEGMVKLVVDGDNRRLLGVHIVGEGATELVHQGQAVLHFGGTVDYFIHATFDVPDHERRLQVRGLRLPAGDGEIAVTDMLALSAHLPVVELAPGEVVVHEGGTGGSIWVLVSGALRVRKGEIEVNHITQPGALVGEISVLLGHDHGATVEATEPSRLRHAADGGALLSDPAVTRLVAVGLAERLNFVTTYLADLKDQYADAPGLSMVSDVLARLAQRQQPAARPGSARDPDPDY